MDTGMIKEKIVDLVKSKKKEFIIVLGIVVLVILLLVIGGVQHNEREKIRDEQMNKVPSATENNITNNATSKSEDENQSVAIYTEDEPYKLKEKLELKKGDKVEVISQGFLETKIRYKNELFVIDSNDFMNRFTTK